MSGSGGCKVWHGICTIKSVINQLNIIIMNRVNFPITIDQLIADALKAKKIYGGDKYVLLSDDEEGNGFHECYYSFSDAKQFADGGLYCMPFDLNPEDCVILG